MNPGLFGTYLPNFRQISQKMTDGRTNGPKDHPQTHIFNIACYSIQNFCQISRELTKLTNRENLHDNINDNIKDIDTISGQIIVPSKSFLPGTKIAGWI